MTSPIDYASDYFHINEPHSPVRLLLLEDFPSDAELIKLQLRKTELELDVQHVSDGKSFKKAFVDFKPHFVISDYSLPQFTGMEALNFVRASSEFIPFIICTGSLNEETAVACIKAGADDYVLKDSLRRLPSAITNALTAKTNVIERAKAIADLEESEANFKALAEHAPDSIYKLDKKGEILYVNRDIDGLPRAQLIGSSILSLVNEENGSIITKALENCYETGEAFDFDIKGNPKDPESKWYFCKLAPVLKNGEVDCVVFIPTQITERVKAEIALKELNEKLHHLTQYLEDIRDEEKKKIAMEIHDQLGQELTGNKLGLFWIRQELSKEDASDINFEGVLEKIDYLVDLTTQTIKTVRRIAHELRPVVLDDIGLVPALEWHIENYNENHEVVCHLKTDIGDMKFDKDFSTAIYRMTQEALTNINRHAQASEAWVNFERSGNFLNLIVKDNGVGIDIEKAMKSKSLGLFGMRERIKKWNGVFEMHGAPEQGTTISLSFLVEEL